MPAHTVRFKQIDVSTSVPFKGNPLVVAFDADAVDTGPKQTGKLAQQLRPGTRYSVRQVTAPRRTVQVRVHYSDARAERDPLRACGKTRLGGPPLSIVNGTFHLP